MDIAPRIQDADRQSKLFRRQHPLVRYAGLAGRTTVHLLLALSVWRMGFWLAARLRAPLNHYTLSEILVYVLIAIITMFMALNTFRPPEDEATLRLWAWSSLLMLSAMIFALTVWFH